MDEIVVAGHELSIDEMKAFKAYTVEGSYMGVERAIGINHTTVSKWSKTEWWADLYDEFVRTSMNDFYIKMNARSGEILDGYMEVMTGEDKNDKTANARISGTKLYMDSGKNPIITKPGIQPVSIDARQVNITINQAKLDELAKNDPEKLLEIAQNGVIPDELIE